MAVRDRLLSTADVAQFLGVPVATLHQWRSRRVGPTGYRIGKHVRYSQDEVDRWLKTRADDPRRTI